jgi:hypothetical protein
MITPSSFLVCGGIGSDCHPALAAQCGKVTIESYGSQLKLRLFKIAQISTLENVQTKSRHCVDRTEMFLLASAGV